MSNYPMTRRLIPEKWMHLRHRPKKEEKLKKNLNSSSRELVFVVELPCVAAASVSMLMDTEWQTLNLSC